jgi:hypothetical protein
MSSDSTGEIYAITREEGNVVPCEVRWVHEC